MARARERSVLVVDTEKQCATTTDDQIREGHYARVDFSARCVRV